MRIDTLAKKLADLQPTALDPNRLPPAKSGVPSDHRVLTGDDVEAELRLHSASAGQFAALARIVDKAERYGGRAKIIAALVEAEGLDARVLESRPIGWLVTQMDRAERDRSAAG